MASPETGINRFAVSTPTKERTVTPVLPKPNVKPAPAFSPPEKPKKKNWVRTKAGRIGLTVVGALGSIGVGVGVAHQINPDIFNRPTASRPAETAAPTLAPKENLFPNTLDTSSFAPITQEQAIKELKDNNIADLETHTIKMFLPIDKETLDNAPNLRYNQKFDAVLPPYVDKTKLEGVKDLTQIDGLPDGTDARAPVGGMLRVVTIAGQKRGTGVDSYVPSYSLVRIDFQDKDGKPISSSFSVLGGIPLLDLSQATWKSNGIRVEAGQKLFKISKANANEGQALKGQEGQIVIGTSYQQQNPRAPIPLTVDFLKEVIVK